MRYLLLFTLVLGLAACETEVKNVDSCGDGFIDPGEQCDGVELGGASCGSLEYYNVTGELTCLPNCTLDVTACGGRCGDNTVDAADGEQCDGENLNSATCATLNYTNGGVLTCDAQCRFDTSACLTTCGNGNLEPGEPCDDGEKVAGDGCAADCTVEPGWECEGETISTCAPICAPGLAFCDRECFDLANDPGHCGSCEVACEANERCVGSVCSPNDAPWIDAGTFSQTLVNLNVTNYAIAACEEELFLYAVNANDSEHPYLMYRLGSQGGGQWSSVTALVIELPEFSDLDAGLAVACAGQKRYALYSLSNGNTEIVVRWYDSTDLSWKPLSSQLNSLCSTTDFIATTIDDDENLHVITNGSGGCGMAVDYGWWDGIDWRAADSMTGSSRQLTSGAMGTPSMATDGERVYIGFADSADQPQWNVRHRVWTWDGDWHQVGPQLDPENLVSNGNESMSLAVGPDGRLCAAYETNLVAGAPVPERIIEVKCLDPGTEEWVRLGAGEVNVGHNAAAPSLVFLGTRPVLAYQQLTRVADQDLWVIRVVRWDPAIEAWEELGVVTGLMTDTDAHHPTLLVQAGRLFLSFEQSDAEDIFASGYVYVKKP